MPKIVLIGGFGWHDIGDEAQLTTPLIYLKKFISDVQFLALSDNPEYTAEYHKVETDYSTSHYLFPEMRNIFSKVIRMFGIDMFIRMIILLFNARRLRKDKKTIFLNESGKRLLNNLKSGDLLFNVGGGNLNSIWRFGGLYSKCITYLICKILGKPIILSGQTIGPIDNWIDRKFARFVLNKVDVITLRDTSSKSILRSIGVVKPVIKETADDAVLLPCATYEDIKAIFLDEKIDAHRPLIGINVIGHGHLSGSKLNKAKQILAEVSDHLISELDARMVFVPMEYISDDDRVTLSETLELMQHKDRVRIIMNEYDDKTLKGIIGQMDIVIGLRYHFIVFATTMQVPSIGIYSDQYYAMKMKGILELMGQEKYACDIDKISSEEIIELAKDALQNKDKIAEELEKRTNVLGEHSLFTIEYAVKLLENKRR